MRRVSRRELRRRWSACGRKHTYASFEEACQAIEWNSFVQPIAGASAEPYDCTYCTGIHVGRAPATSRQQRRKRSEARRRPSLRVANRRLDLTLVIELGERALWCGRLESEGGLEKRRRTIGRRGRRSSVTRAAPR